MESDGTRDRRKEVRTLRYPWFPVQVDQIVQALIEDRIRKKR